MSESQPISGNRIWLGFYVVRGGVDTRSHRYFSCIFGAVEIRGIHSSGVAPYLPCVRWKCHPFVGLYPPRTGEWSLNKSAISQQDWSFLTVQGGVYTTNFGLLLRLMDVLEE